MSKKPIIVKQKDNETLDEFFDRLAETVKEVHASKHVKKDETK